MAKSLLYPVGASDIELSPHQNPSFNFFSLTKELWGKIKEDRIKLLGTKEGWLIKNPGSKLKFNFLKEKRPEQILIKFPIFMHILREFRKEELIDIYLFATYQNPPHEKDTFYAAKIMEKFIQQRLKAENIIIKKIKDNPSNYDKMTLFFKRFVDRHKKELENNSINYVSITCGTPAQISALALNVMDLPVSYIYISKKEGLTYPKIFTRLNKRIYLNIIKELIGNFNYSSACEIAENSSLRNNSILLSLLKIMSKRALFDFEGALNAARDLKDKEFLFIAEELSNLARGDKASLWLELFYHFENAIEKKDFLEALARLFSLADYVLQCLFVSLTGVKIEKSKGHFSEFNKYIEDRKELKSHLEKKRISWKDNPSQIVLAKIINFIKGEDKKIQRFMELIKDLEREKETDYGKLSLRRLRNSGPYAHGTKGINEKIMGQLFHPLSIKGFAEKIRECIKCICGKEPQNSFKVINKKLIEVLEKEVI